ncbi:Hypothetical protein FKW44_001297 [Caligus rogercresseyi]|uniref:Uncharacterized protein n=1 Tax=Caligus rogercresseyi TaxID=217165 RepID=A0A7T8QVI1_CALRO|nr:Hypothetical protein FKW44_001297 [Caligus rogercresseyi]
MAIQDFQKAAKTAMYHVHQIIQDTVEKGVNPVDFLLITFVNEKLPARAVADWEAMLIGKEEEHKRRNVLEGQCCSLTRVRVIYYFVILLRNN